MCEQALVKTSLDLCYTIYKVEVLPLSIHQWMCLDCGTIHDRGIDVAINLKNLAVSSTVSACREEGASLGRKSKTKLASVNQELSAEHV